MKKNLLIALFVLAVLPACKKSQKCNACNDAYEVQERVSGPAGWDFEEDTK